MKLTRDGSRYYEIPDKKLESDRVIKTRDGGYRLIVSQNRKTLPAVDWWPFSNWHTAWTAEAWDKMQLNLKKKKEKTDKRREQRRRERKDRKHRAKLLEEDGIPVLNVMDRIKNREYDDLLASLEKMARELKSYRRKYNELTTLVRHGAEPEEIRDWIEYHLINN